MDKNLSKCKRFPARKLLKELSYKLEKNRKRGTSNNKFLKKLQAASSTERTGGSGGLFYVACSFTRYSVETELLW